MKPMTAFKSILNCRCPRCRNGKVFTYSNHYNRKFTDIESKCGNCSHSNSYNGIIILFDGIEDI